MSLPQSAIVPVNLLSASFNNTSATYKFYWLLAIIEAVENGEQAIMKKDLFARMISQAWFTVNYFHISFGKQDKLQKAIEIIRQTEKIAIDEDRKNVFSAIRSTTNPVTLDQLKHFDNQVPHWFLSPWFPGYQKSGIYEASLTFSNQCLYQLRRDQIFINPDWIVYILENARIIKNFCYWNLVLFLQKKNPNVPDIPNKVIKPAFRSSLTPQRKGFWNIVFDELKTVKCIYTGNQLTKAKYAVEHFIPYSFVSHNLIWNLLPADPSFNCSKSNKLPNLDLYFTPFFKLHKQSVEIVKKNNPNNSILEDYLTIFPGLDTASAFSTEFTAAKFKERLQPLITIASNNGFEYMK